MSLKPGEEIGEETHDDVDQFFRFEGGEGKVIIDNVEHRVKDGNGVISLRALGIMWSIHLSTGPNLRLYTIYTPAEHQDGVVRHTRKEAIASEEHFDGRTTRIVKL